MQQIGGIEISGDRLCHPAYRIADVLASAGFGLERDLVAALHEGAPAALDLRDRWFHIRSEVTIRDRVADLVLVHASLPPATKPSRVSYFEAAILALLLERGASTVETVAAELFADSSSIQIRVSKLAKLGFVDIDGRRVRPTEKRVTKDLRVIAIEAKLTRWREAIGQAASNSVFANESYIAMPSSVFHKSGAVLSACRSAGVGALAVEPDKSIIVVLDAPAHEPQSPEWLRLVSSVGGFAQDSKAPLHVA